MAIYITGWMLKYYCFSCKHVAMVEMAYESIGGIKRILALGEEFRRCPKCNEEKFRMISANIARSKSKYGDTEGVWKCGFHQESYYPIAIERAFNIIHHHLDAIVVERYKDVARLGMPLRCPKCKELLKYHRSAGCLIDGAF